MHYLKNRQKVIIQIGSSFSTNVIKNDFLSFCDFVIDRSKTDASMNCKYYNCCLKYN